MTTKIVGKFEVERIDRVRHIPGKGSEESVNYVHVHGTVVYPDDVWHEPADLSLYLPKKPNGDSPVRIGQAFRVTIEIGDA